MSPAATHLLAEAQDTAATAGASRAISGGRLAGDHTTPPSTVRNGPLGLAATQRSTE